MITNKFFIQVNDSDDSARNLCFQNNICLSPSLSHAEILTVLSTLIDCVIAPS